MSFPFYQQDDETSCGAYCLKMILKYYRIDEDIVTIKARTKMDASGTTVRGMIAALRSYEIEAKAYHATLDDVEEKVALPCILHTVHEECGHFVVLYDIAYGIYKVADPATGKINYTKEELEGIYTQNVIVMTHLGRYYSYHNERLVDFLWQGYLAHRRELRPFMAVSFFLAVFSYVTAALFQCMIDIIKPDAPMIQLIWLVILFFSANLISLALTKVNEHRTIRLIRLFDRTYIFRAIKQILSLPETFFYQGNGRVVTKVNDFYELMRYMVLFYKGVCVDVIIVIGLLSGLCLISLPMTIFAVFFLGVIAVYLYLFSPGLYDACRQYLSMHQRNGDALISLIAHRVIGRRYYGASTFLKDYQESFDGEAEAKMTRDEAVLRFSLHIQLLQIISGSAVILTGFFFYHQGLLGMGDVIMFYMIEAQLSLPVIDLCQVFTQYHEASLLYEHYKEFMQEVPVGHVSFDEPIRDIQLINVTFSYGYHVPVFEHLDLHITKTTFLLGDNGTGKSTLLMLLMGQDLSYRGEILLNGCSLKELSPECLMQHIGYVGDHDVFLRGTLFDNLHCQDQDAITRMFHLLECEDLIFHLEDTLTSEGLPLSRGQCQLLSLARALLQDNDVYLLDEAFGHIDLAHAMRIITRLKENYPEKIFIIVTHQTNFVNEGDECVIMSGDKKP